MRIVKMRNGEFPIVGVVGEKNATRIIFETFKIAKSELGCSRHVLLKRPDDAVYPLTAEMYKGQISVVLGEDDVCLSGRVEFEVQLRSDNIIVKSVGYSGRILSSLVETGKVPEVDKDWTDKWLSELSQVQVVSQEAKTAAEQAKSDSAEARQLASQSAQLAKSMLVSTLSSAVSAANTPVKSVGNPLQIWPNERALLKPVTVLDPKQEGSGYPYPAGGGRNIIDLSSPPTNNNNASISFDGKVATVTSTNSSAEVNYVRYVIIKNPEPGTVFTLSVGSIVASALNIPQARFIFSVDGTGVISNIVGAGESSTIVVPEYNGEGSLRVNLYAHNKGSSSIVAVKGDYATFSNVQVERGSAATAWQPYSNIRPISGWTEAKLTRAGKNLMPLVVLKSVFVSNGDGVFALAANTTGASVATKFLFKAGVEYTLSATTIKGTGLKPCIIVRNPDDASAYYSNYANASKPVTVHFDNDTEWNVIIQTGSASGHAAYGESWAIQIEIGSASEYEPYQGDTYNADFGQTVYGGSVDWQTGKLTIDRAMVTLNGTEVYDHAVEWSDGSYSVSNVIPDAVKVSGYATIAEIVCSHAITAAPQDIVNGSKGIAIGQANTSLYFNFGTQYNTQALIAGFVSGQNAAGTPVQIAYKLATPIEIQLEPHEINTLQGVNTLYGNGSIEVQYYKSLTKTLEEALSKIE